MKRPIAYTAWACPDLDRLACLDYQTIQAEQRVYATRDRARLVAFDTVLMLAAAALLTAAIALLLGAGTAHAAPTAWRYNAPSETWKACEQAFTRHSTTWPYCGR